MAKNQRVIRRVYRQKKTGKLITKEYRYAAKRRKSRGVNLMTKKGGLQKERIEKFIQNVLATVSDEADKKIMENEIRYRLFEYEEDIRAGREFVVKEQTLLAQIQEDRYLKMFINAGVDVYDLASEYNIPVEELSNPNNWNSNSTVFTWGNKKFEFEFNYYGSVFNEVK